MKKRFLFVLALALTSLFSVFLLSSCCFPVDGGDPSATQGLEYELNEDGESYYLKGIGTASGEIVIASTYNKKPVTAIGDEAFISCDDVTSIMIPDSVTSIGDHAFSSCTDLMSVTIGNGVTSIGDHAFYGCTSLTSITLPFVGASLNGTGATHFGYIFGASSFWDNGDYVPTSLKTVVITGDKRIDGMAFRGCTGLTSVTIPDSVTSIGWGAFRDCTGLTSVTIGNGVTSIGDDAFHDCIGLTSVTIPNSVTSIGEGAFEGCTGLTSITLPFVGASLNGTSNIHFGYIFGANSSVPTSLKTVVITGVTSIGSGAFRDCTGLMSVTIGNGVISIGSGAFDGCTGLTSVTIGNSVTSIGSYAFRGCTRLTSITIPASVTSIGFYAFRGCERLYEVTFEEVSGWQTEGNNIHINTIANQREVAKLLQDDYSYYSWYRN